LVEQVAQRMEIDVIRVWLGALWPCMEAIALRGMSMAAWADKAKMGRNAAPGYLLAAMDRLLEYYRMKDTEPERRQRMRMVRVEGARV
jgi:hypothetical protein